MSNSEENDVFISEDYQRAYGQWVEITIYAVNADFTVNDAYTRWGKFHKPGDKNYEVSSRSINGTIIKDGDKYTIASCGRSDASSGTEGGFSLYDGDKLVFRYYWDCPWGSKNNNDSLDEKDKDGYYVTKSGGNYYGGALGNVFIAVMKR